MKTEPPSTEISASPGDGVCEISLQNPCRYPEAAARRIRPWLSRLVAALAPKAESLSVRFASDRELSRLNRTFRSKEGPTDVLSFPGEITAEGRHLGDLAISVPRARQQAENAGHSTDRELRLLLLHGLLHCLGYDHEVDDGTMETVEARLRRRWLETS